MANLEDILEYTSKLLLLSNDDQDKAATESSLVVVQGVDVSFGETTEVNGLEVANAKNKVIAFGNTKLVEPTEIKVNPNEPKETTIKQATPAEKEATVLTDGLVSSPMKAIDLTDMDPIETIDCTDMVSVHSGEVTKPARSEAKDLTERPLSSSRGEDPKSNKTQGTSEASYSRKPKVVDTETNLKETVTHPSGKRLAEAMDYERSMKEGKAESKSDTGDTKEEMQVEITVEEVGKEDERIMVKDGDVDEREGLKIMSSEDKTSEKSEVQVDATELCEDETEEKTPVDAKELREVKTGEKTSVVVTTQKRDILDFFFESTEMFLCGPSQHDAILRDDGKSALQGDSDDVAQGSLVPSSDSQSSALLHSAIPLDSVEESQPCELTEDPIS
jgi:hypothetical protein